MFQGGNVLKKDCFMWRAYIAQHKYRVVLDGIADAFSTPPALKAIRKVAEYFNSIGKPHIHIQISNQKETFAFNFDLIL